MRHLLFLLCASCAGRIADDELERFAARGVNLPAATEEGRVTHAGAQIHYASFGSGAPVVLLHGGLGHGGNWGYQVPALVRAGYRAIVIDTRGHGRSTRDERPLSYELFAEDVVAVLDALLIDKAAFVGWSDGAIVSLIIAMQHPQRVRGVLFFGCNMDPSGTKPFVMTAVVERCFKRHAKDYEKLSETPDQFEAFASLLGDMMQTQPRYAARDLGAISVPVTIVHSAADEFIKREHAEYMARTIPRAELVTLDGVSHFAPLQRPEMFNDVVSAFLAKI